MIKKRCWHLGGSEPIPSSVLNGSKGIVDLTIVFAEVLRSLSAAAVNGAVHMTGPQAARCRVFVFVFTHSFVVPAFLSYCSKGAVPRTGIYAAIGQSCEGEFHCCEAVWLWAPTLRPVHTCPAVPGTDPKTGTGVIFLAFVFSPSRCSCRCCF